MSLPYVVTCCTAKKVSLISCSLLKQGNNGSTILVADYAGLRRPGFFAGEMNSTICKIFLHLFNSWTYFRIISWPCVPYLAISGETETLKFPFPLTEDPKNGLTDLSVYKFRVLIGIGMKKDLFLGSVLHILLQAYPVQWTSSARCSSVTLSCVYMFLPVLRGFCWDGTFTVLLFAEWCNIFDQWVSLGWRRFKGPCFPSYVVEKRLLSCSSIWLLHLKCGITLYLPHYLTWSWRV